MAKQFQLRRGTQTEHSTFKGALGEITVDTTRKALILHDGVTTGGILITSTGTPLGCPLWHNGARSSIDVGYLAMDGDLLSRASYPVLWAKIQKSFNLVTDTVWLADPTKRTCYSSGDGSTTFRMPDLNGRTSLSIKSPVLRGDGYSASGTALADAIRNITGEFKAVVGPTGHDTPAGAFSVKTKSNAAVGSAGSDDWARQWLFDASTVVPTADENRPNSAFGVWICRVGDITAEAGDPTKNAVITGGNTFNGSQQINGDVSCTNVIASGTIKGNLDPATLNSTGTAPFFGARAWVNFNSVPLTGTYSQSGTTVTVTMTAHGMSVGQIVNLSITSGSAFSGSYTVTGVQGANTFTYSAATSGTNSGNVTRNLYIIASGNVSSVLDLGLGNYQIQFYKMLPHANYATAPDANISVDGVMGAWTTAYERNTGYCKMRVFNSSGNASDAVNVCLTVTC